MSPKQDLTWQVYMILCSDDSFYTGITTDVDRRFNQHATGRGAKYFRGRSPQRVVFREAGHSRSSATRRELDLKKLTHAEKQALVSAYGMLSQETVPVTTNTF